MTETAQRAARIAGLDVARAVALIGMFAAHVGNIGTFGPGGARWLLITHGRSAALFALLSGVSIAIMLGNATSRLTQGEDPVRYTRIRLVVRSGLLIVISWIVSSLGTPVDIILDNLGVMFLLACFALTWKPWMLMGVGAAILAFGRPILGRLVDVVPSWLVDVPVIHELWSMHYPALLWIGYVLIGMGLGKLRPWHGPMLAWLIAQGAVLVALFYGGAWWFMASRGEPIIWDNQWGVTTTWYEISAHAYTAPEMLGNVGVAFVVIGACCLLSGLLPRLTWPIAATGSMTLTLYIAHLLVIAIVGLELVFEPRNVSLAVMCAAFILFASLWKWRFEQGPLEKYLTVMSTVAADADARRARVSHPA